MPFLRGSHPAFQCPATLLFSVCERPPQTPSGARPEGTDATITFLPFRLRNNTVLWCNHRAVPAAPRCSGQAAIFIFHDLQSILSRRQYASDTALSNRGHLSALQIARTQGPSSRVCTRSHDVKRSHSATNSFGSCGAAARPNQSDASGLGAHTSRSSRR